MTLNREDVAVERLARALWAYEGPPDELWEAVDRGPTRDPIRAKAAVLLKAVAGDGSTLDPWYGRAVQAETLLWALAVWFDAPDNPYAQRDLDSANGYLNRHGLTDADAMRNRLTVLQEEERSG